MPDTKTVKFFAEMRATFSEAVEVKGPEGLHLTGRPRGTITGRINGTYYGNVHSVTRPDGMTFLDHLFIITTHDGVNIFIRISGLLKAGDEPNVLVGKLVHFYIAPPGAYEWMNRIMVVGDEWVDLKKGEVKITLYEWE